MVVVIEVVAHCMSGDLINVMDMYVCLSSGINDSSSISFEVEEDFEVDRIGDCVDRNGHY